MSQEKKPFVPFSLNFGNEDRMKTITLPEEDAIYRLADVLVQILNDNNIKNEVTEVFKINPIQDANEIN